MSRRLGLLCVSILCFTAVLPRTASAQTASAQTETADTLLARGVELRRTGQDQQALELFRRAFEMSHSPRAEAQMGLAEQALGRWLDADLHVREAYAAATDPWIQSHRAGLDASLAVIDQHVGRLEIIGNVPGAELLVNGQPAGTLPLAQPLRLIAGTVNFEVRASGHQPTQRALTVTPGRLSRESIDLTPRAATTAAERADRTTTTTVTTAQPVEPSGAAVTPAISATMPAASATTRDQAAPASGAQASGISPVVAIIGLGATVILGGATILSGLDTLNARDAYVLDPTEQRYNDGLVLQTRTNVLIGAVSVVGVATLAIALFATRWGGDSDAHPANAPRAQRRRTLPFLGASSDGFALGVHGAF